MAKTEITKPLAPDRTHIDLDGPDVKHWEKLLGVPREELARLIEKVGNSAAAVRKELETTRQAAPDGKPMHVLSPVG